MAVYIHTIIHILISNCYGFLFVFRHEISTEVLKKFPLGKVAITKGSESTKIHWLSFFIVRYGVDICNFLLMLHLVNSSKWGNQLNWRVHKLYLRNQLFFNEP